MIHVEEKALNKLLGTGYFMNSVVMVDVGGKAARTLPKDVAFHPVTDRPLHVDFRSEEHTSELQSLMRISYAVFCLKKKKYIKINTNNDDYNLLRQYRHAN